MFRHRRRVQARLRASPGQPAELARHARLGARCRSACRSITGNPSPQQAQRRIASAEWPAAAVARRAPGCDAPAAGTQRRSGCWAGRTVRAASCCPPRALQHPPLTAQVITSGGDADPQVVSAYWRHAVEQCLKLCCQHVGFGVHPGAPFVFRQVAVKVVHHGIHGLLSSKASIGDCGGRCWMRLLAVIYCHIRP